MCVSIYAIHLQCNVLNLVLIIINHNVCVSDVNCQYIYNIMLDTINLKLHIT